MGTFQMGRLLISGNLLLAAEAGGDAPTPVDVYLEPVRGRTGVGWWTSGDCFETSLARSLTLADFVGETFAC